MPFVILALSIVLQFVAAFLALRLIRITDHAKIWWPIAIAICFMALRRCLTLYGLIFSGLPVLPIDITAELTSLATSTLMVVGVILLTPLLRSTQRSLERLRIQYDTILNSAGEGIFGMDQEGHVLFVNPAAMKICGFTEEELLGKNPHTLLHHTRPDGTPHPIESCQVNLSLQDGKVHRITEDVFWTRDKTPVVVEYVTTPIQENGHVIGTVVVFRDISKQKLAEQALLQSEERYRSIFENASIGIFQTTREGKPVSVNPALANILGYDSPEEVINSVYSVSEQIYADPGRREEIIHMAEHNLKVVNLETEFVRKDGQKRVANLNLRVVRDETQTASFVEGFIEDITERRQAEETLKTERQRLTNLLEELPAYVCLIAPDRTLSYCNRRFCEIFGEPKGRTCYELIHGRQEPCEDCQTFQVFETKRMGMWEWTSQEGRTYQIYDYPFSDIDGSPMVLQMGVDITDRKQLEETLKESEERLRYLTSQLMTAQESERKRISMELHDELGQAMTVLKLQMRDIKKRLPADLPGLQEDCEHTSDYVDEMIQKVRRISRDLSPSVLENFGLKAALKYLFTEFEKYHEVKISVDMDDINDLLPSQAGIVVYRIIQESLNNVAKYAEASQVTASIKKFDSTVSFTLTDNGKGFEVEEALSRDVSKRGLGLAALQERVRMLGGTLKITSQKGVGSRISFNIPINIVP